MSVKKSTLLIGLVGIILCGSLLRVAYVHRWIIRFAIRHRTPCVLWTKKFRTNADALTMIAPLLPKNPVIIEAGAWNGVDSVNLANFWKQGHVHCFEPIPELYNTVVENIKNHNNISSYQIALADKEGEADFYVSSSESAPNSPSASSSLLAPERHLVEFPNIIFKKKINVQTTTLDRWAENNKIDHIDFIWLDTQGSELSILKNAPKILKTVKAILTEVEFIEAYKNQPLFSDVKAWMQAHGFRLAALHLGCDWYGDALFVRSAD